MSRHFDSTDNAELRAKIDKAKTQLPLPDLMRRLGLPEKHIGKTALCPFHDDNHPSFSVFQKNGVWLHKCFVGCSSGDEIAFLVKHLGVSRGKAISRFLEMAGFPARSPSKSHEYPVSHVSPEYPVSPVSEGQVVDGELDKQLAELAERNACTRVGDIVAKKRFKLARDLTAFQKKLGRKLTTIERRRVSNEWHRISEPYLDSAEKRDDHFTAFLAELQKVRVPTGEGALTKALENVARLSLAELPMIPDYPDAPERWRRLAALHRELSRLCGGGIYFLSYRDAAKVCDGLSHQEAHTITFALATLGVIEIDDKGQSGANGGKAAEFVYLLPQSKNGAAEDDGEIEI